LNKNKNKFKNKIKIKIKNLKDFQESIPLCYFYPSKNIPNLSSSLIAILIRLINLPYRIVLTNSTYFNSSNILVGYSYSRITYLE